MRAVGRSLDEIGDRPLRTFSGGEQKRLALEVLLRGDADILVLDEPDNFLDVEAKRWLEGELVNTRKTVLYVSHDRELLAATATKVVTVESAGRSATNKRHVDPRRRVRGYAEARHNHLDKLEHDRTSYDDERKHLEELVAEMRRRAKISEVFGPKLKAAESRLRQFVEHERAARRSSATSGSRCASVARAPASGRWSSSSSSSTGSPTRSTSRSTSASGWRCSAATAPARATSSGCSTATRRSTHHGRWRLGAGVVAGPVPPDP